MNDWFSWPFAILVAVIFSGLVLCLFLMVRFGIRAETRNIRMRLDAYSNLLTEILLAQGYTKEQVEEIKRRPRS